MSTVLIVDDDMAIQRLLGLGQDAGALQTLIPASAEKSLNGADIDLSEFTFHDLRTSAVSVVEELPQQVKTEQIRLYIAEEQQIMREAYRTFYVSSLDVSIVGSSEDTHSETLVTAAATLKPDVIIVGTKVLQPSTVEKLKTVREYDPEIGIVILSAYYDVKGIMALREYSKGAQAGCAYLQKHTLDTVNQLTQVIKSVAEGRIIVDPAVMNRLMTSDQSGDSFLKELSPRELEVLGWMAKGYRNGSIAETLCLEPKTVERHINSIYSKLGSRPEPKHARVHAIIRYLKARGLLPAEEFTDDEDESA